MKKFDDMKDDLPWEQTPAKSKSKGKMQGSRLLLILCAHCDYRLRGTNGAFEKCGIPKCPGCKRQMKLIV